MNDDVVFIVVNEGVICLLILSFLSNEITVPSVLCRRRN